MTQEKVNKKEYFTSLMFALYFTLLFTERLISFFRSVADNDVKLFEGMFNGFAYSTVMTALGAAAVLIIATNAAFLLSPYTFNNNIHKKINYEKLCMAAGIALIAGMVHTEYTISALQFCAYGALIVAMAIKTASHHSVSTNKAALWLSFAYLVALSMAIPVVYPAAPARDADCVVIDAGIMFALVVCFTVLLQKMFADSPAENLFYYSPITIAAAGNLAVLCMVSSRLKTGKAAGAITDTTWASAVNLFAFIFLITAAILWTAGKLVVHIRNKKPSLPENCPKKD